ncbi:DUF4488 domain-containing protein [Mucilaginibacter sp. dw_454]|uniref:DUF4488 domain-containing protein n=1 Tax=Mucilaginibacter sp. dw_454 TaxID=2720079 RepID=UPI001BD3B70D|nr:DUF4488 domain-containing protein [Mucilaginibacter sp. dw_454]
MKVILKAAALLICFHFCASGVFAQTNEKAFYGSWELDQSAYYGRQEPPTRYTKIFNADHTFANLQTQAGKTFTSHSGKYQVNNDDYYTERALYVKEGMSFVFKDKDVIIHYHFSDDKKWLTFSFTVQNGTAFTERWRRSDQAYADNSNLSQKKINPTTR